MANNSTNTTRASRFLCRKADVSVEVAATCYASGPEPGCLRLARRRGRRDSQTGLRAPAPRNSSSRYVDEQKPRKSGANTAHKKYQGCGPAAAPLAAMHQSGDGCKGAQHRPSRVTPGSAVDERGHLPLCSGLRIPMFDRLLGFTARGVGDEHGRIGCSALDALRSCGRLEREKRKEPRRRLRKSNGKSRALLSSTHDGRLRRDGGGIQLLNSIHGEPTPSSASQIIQPMDCRLTTNTEFRFPRPSQAGSPGFDTAQTAQTTPLACPR
ncbi:hypothetical protein BKA56DRAFT_719999 [Ilyonectria sp. MPI-CAGE-AT-0026]|nr:hypothetical protein BKA56DRAFT_719999 [Ilyonectria sp. MPI-CAGE-AT-0026]